MPRVFHGWFVVAGAFGITFFGFGSAYSFSVFVASLEHAASVVANLIAAALTMRLPEPEAARVGR